MGTRNELVPLKKQSIFYNVNENNKQYSNLNLSQNLKCLNASLVQSNSKSSSNNKSLDSKFLDNGNLRLWNKSSLNTLHSKAFKSLTPFDEAEENAKTKRWKSDSSHSTITTTSSTLSLHIAAYENSIEDDTASLDKKESLKKELINKQKQILINSAMNPFDFPRQQTDSGTHPAVMQFVASQKLLNPNQSDSSKNKQQMTQNVTEMCEAFPSDLIKDIRIMNIKKNSKASNIVKFVINELKKEETKRILFHGEGEACEKVVTHVEIVKREFLPESLYQWTRIDGKIDEATKKRIGILEILLSKESFDVTVSGQQCSTDENIGAALPPPKKTVPALPIKRMQFGGSEGKPVSIGNKAKAIGFADALLPILKPRQTFDLNQAKKGGKRKGEIEEEANPFSRPKKRPNSKSSAASATSESKKENNLKNLS